MHDHRKDENASGETKKYTEKTNVYVTEEMDDADIPGRENRGCTGKEGASACCKIAIGVAAVIVIIVIVR